MLGAICQLAEMTWPSAVLFLVGALMIETASSATVKAHFSYSPTDRYGPKNWHKLWPVCKGVRQSPINIVTNTTVRNTLLGFKYQPIKKMLGGILQNNGHVPVFTFTAGNTLPILTGVPHHETDKFVFVNLHLHFANNSRGSEHTVNGKKFAGEFHLVHYNKKYGSFANAVEKPDGLAVIAVFLEDLGHPSPLHVEELIVETEETTTHGAQLSLSINPISFLPTAKTFYTYKGSLTTPACQESVTWIVMASPISVPTSDMESLRLMTDKKGKLIAVHGNLRPQALLGNRTIESNF